MSPPPRIQPVILVAALTLLAGRPPATDRLASKGEGSPPHGRPLLYRAIDVPEQLLGTHRKADGTAVRFAGDVRLGDLTGDGRADLLAIRSVDGGMKPSFLGAFTLDGEVLWRVGEGGQQPNRPAPVAVHDIDADGQSEVVCLFVEGRRRRHWQSLENVVLQIRDGRTGRIERENAPRELCRHGRPGPPRTNPRHWNAPNWVHQRVLIADLRGNDSPQDFVIKFGLKVFAFDHRLRKLWSYDIPAKWERYGRHTAYIPAVGDIDGDGRDEVTGGYYLLDDDGRPMWEQQLGPHMDSVAITAWDDGRLRAVCSGHGCVVDESGRVLLRLGGEDVPHGQEVRVADFDPGSAGPEMIIRADGHTRGVIVVSTGGRVLRRFELNRSANNTGMEVVFWNGPEEPALLSNGGVLWSGKGESLGRLPGLPEPRRPVAPKECPGWRMPWYHTIPADVCGDRREEVLLYNPWDTTVFVYTPSPLREGVYGGYRPGPRGYNARLMD